MVYFDVPKLDAYGKCFINAVSIKNKIAEPSGALSDYK